MAPSKGLPQQNTLLKAMYISGLIGVHLHPLVLQIKLPITKFLYLVYENNNQNVEVWHVVVSDHCLNNNK